MTRDEAEKRISNAITSVVTRPGRRPRTLTHCEICADFSPDSKLRHYRKHTASRGFHFWQEHAALLKIHPIPTGPAYLRSLPILERWLVRHAKRAQAVGWVQRVPGALQADPGLLAYLQSLTGSLHDRDAALLLTNMLVEVEYTEGLR